MNTGVDAKIDPLIGRRPLSPQFCRGFVQTTDGLFVLLSGCLSYFFVYGTSFTEANHLYVLLVTVLFSGFAFHALGCYRIDQMFSPVPRMRRMLAAWAIVAGVLLVLAASLSERIGFSQTWFLWWFAVGMALLVVFRGAVGIGLGRRTVSRLIAQRTLIFGAGEVGRRLATHFDSRPNPLVRLVGFIDDRTSRVPSTVGGLSVLGGMDKLVAMVRNGSVEQVLIALPWSAEARIGGLLEELDKLPIQVRLAPDLVGYSLTHRPTSTIGGLSFIDAVDRPLAGMASLIKAAEDRILAVAMLIVFLPVMAVIAMAIKLDSPGPVLFRQTRLGFNDRKFSMFKFRSMYDDMTDADGSLQATRNDFRVTRVGRFLRRYSLDELPQVFNVLAGDMSVVGPRPHPIGMVAAGRRLHEAVRNYAGRHKVRPGITGWAQVNGWRGETDTLEKIEKRVEHDLYYIENWSLWLDAWILLKTAFVVFQARNAY